MIEVTTYYYTTKLTLYKCVLQQPNNSKNPLCQSVYIGIKNILFTCKNLLFLLLLLNGYFYMI